MSDAEIRTDLATLRRSLPDRGHDTCPCSCCQAHRALDRLEQLLLTHIRELTS